MTPKEIADLYYSGWINKMGDLSEVPIARNFRFRGQVASFDSAEGYRAMAREAGAMVTKFTVRHQFVDGNRVCSIIDWESRPHVREMDFTGRPMKGMVFIEPDGLDEPALGQWVTRAAAFVRSLPARPNARILTATSPMEASGCMTR